MRSAYFSISMFCFFLASAVAQDESISLTELSKAGSKRLEIENARFSNKKGFTFSYNPLVLAGNSFLWVYQKVFSEQVNAECGFSPSCSSFARGALKERGFIVGVLLSVDRLTRCNGLAQAESETYLVDKKTGKLHDDPGMYKRGH